MSILRCLDFAQQLVKSCLTDGDCAVDATVGNGYDTVFLAQQVGPNGIVYGFDIQFRAISHTTNQLKQSGFLQRVKLFSVGHECMPDYLPQEKYQHIKAVMFNLGFLPGTERQIITKPETTQPALDVALDWLCLGGIITIVLYSGHSGAEIESEAVEKWAAKLDQKKYHVCSYTRINQVNDPPRLIAIEKRIPR